MSCCGKKKQRCACGSLPASWRVDHMGRRVEPGNAPMGASLTTDLDGESNEREQRERELPFGAQPAVPERPVTAPRHLELPSQGERFGGGDPNAPRLVETPFGRHWVVGADRVVLSGARGMPSAGSAVRGRMIPALPATQEVCVMGGFDPAWGTPPSEVQALPVRFDSDIGAYRFDPAYSLSRKNVDNDMLAARFYEQQRRRWKQEGLALQPFKRPGTSRWAYRWIPNVKTAQCFASEAALRAYQERTNAEPAAQMPEQLAAVDLPRTAPWRTTDVVRKSN